MTKQEALQKIKELEEFINQPEDLFSKIKNYSDICKELGEEELKESDFKFLHKKDRKKALNQAIISQGARLFNGDWEARFDGKQKNWYPYFAIGSGMVLGFDSSGCIYSYCYGGFTGYFKDQKTSDFVGKLLITNYRELV